MDAIVQARTAVSAVDQDAITLIRDLPVRNAEEKEFAAEGLRLVKAWHAALEEQRTAITGPMNQSLRGVNDLFRPMKTALEEAERTVKRRIAGYLEQCERDNLAAIQAAAVAPSAEQAEDALALVEAAAPPAGVSIRYQWVFEVVDANLLPREYLEPAMWKIGRAVRDSDGTIEIPGITVRQEPIVTSRKIR
jgi:hypothetical protein